MQGIQEVLEAVSDNSCAIYHSQIPPLYHCPHQTDTSSPPLITWGHGKGRELAALLRLNCDDNAIASRINEHGK
jgi:hypothetical protein